MDIEPINIKTAKATEELKKISNEKIAINKKISLKITPKREIYSELNFVSWVIFFWIVAIL